MTDIFGENIKSSIINSLKHTPEITDVSELERISDNLSNAVTGYQKNGNKSIQDWLSADTTIDVFKKLSFHPEDFALLVRASVIDFQELKSEISNIAKKKFQELITDENILKKGCWYYLDKKSNNFITDAITTATCLYALYKTSNHLCRNIPFEAVKNKIIAWLFNKNIYCNDTGVTGWNKKIDFKQNEKNQSQNQKPTLYETAYVLNILIRVHPERPDRCYENTLQKNIIESFGKFEKDCWVESEIYSKSEKILTTSYCLRVISTYLKYLDNRPSNFLDANMINDIYNIQHQASLKLSTMKDNDSWDSNLSLTAAAVQALRTSNFKKNNPSISESCDWLINKLEYFEGSWCWTKEEGGKTKKSLIDSAPVISALMRGCDFKKFSRTETVFLWMLKELKDISVIDKETVPVLCAFTDYLRALDEPYFLEKS